jgi:hypothetical protein
MVTEKLGTRLYNWGLATRGWVGVSRSSSLDRIPSPRRRHFHTIFFHALAIVRHARDFFLLSNSSDSNFASSLTFILTFFPLLSILQDLDDVDSRVGRVKSISRRQPVRRTPRKTA